MFGKVKEKYEKECENLEGFLGILHGHLWKEKRSKFK